MGYYMNKLNKDKFNTKISESIFMVQEAERKRIARDLHDATLQDLTYILHKLDLLGLYVENDSEKVNLELKHIKESLKKTMNDIRHIIFDLRPAILDDLGLREAFDVFFTWLKNNTTFEYVLDIENIYTDKLILLNIYRISVECVMNAVKYSEGTQIKFLCKNIKNNIVLCIEDNGKGFDNNIICTNKLNHGISIMNERVKVLDGNITYTTDIGKGVKIDISIPMIV